MVRTTTILKVPTQGVTATLNEEPSEIGGLSVKSRTTTAPPAAPALGDAFIVPAGATGPWDGYQGRVLSWAAGWNVWTMPIEGMRAWVQDEDTYVRFDGSAWVEDASVGSGQTSITASTTQTQGEGALTKVVNHVTTCANSNDAVTLPAAVAGLMCVVANNGAATLQVFPASGDAIDAGAADASTTIAATKRRVFYAVNGTTWVSILGA